MKLIQILILSSQSTISLDCVKEFFSCTLDMVTGHFTVKNLMKLRRHISLIINRKHTRIWVRIPVLYFWISNHCVTLCKLIFCVLVFLSVEMEDTNIFFVGLFWELDKIL